MHVVGAIAENAYYSPALCISDQTFSGRSGMSMNVIPSGARASNTALTMVGGAAIIIFAVFLIVRERTQEIGLLRAIGASTWQIVHQFAMETLALGLAAAAVATALVALFAGTIARQFTSSTPRSGTSPTGGRIFTRGTGNLTPPAGGFAQFGGTVSRTLSAGLTPETVLLVFALGIGLAILANVVPAWYVTRVRPATALRTVG